ncbi:hypothetical protein Acid345_0744 [Candidatus Koribacter versatilis Ellin345]|uniref:peptidylprolyl isomerase n=1 Tax=Koribacter versatilis (strain Ellin345) TaxID=204669 RepID=Q1ITQ1_KORVE|nr:peptidylprolyl isomerase [Candidatus Koribacter versatilis]ABF39749.1 hypothetical protein Acid345_0744 [Candidatus Koribacter versatilis Ellin345]
MKYAVQSAALVLISVSAAFAQMASHAPTAVAKERTATTSVPAARPVDETKPVARVNGTVLTERDLLREMYTIFPYAAQHNGVPKKMEPEMRKGALQMIVFEELVYQEAVRRKITFDPSIISKGEAEMRKQFPSQQEFDAWIVAQFGSRQAMHEKMRRTMLVQILLKKEVNDKSVVTDAQAKAFYEANSKQFDRPETFSIQTISIIPPQGANPEVKKEADKRAHDAFKAAKATKTYEEFGLLAEKVSDDDWHVKMGDRKAIDRASLPPDVVKAALVMKPGEVSDLIQIGPNYTMFRLNAHTPAGRTPFGEVKAKLQEDMKKAKTEQLRGSFDKQLRQSAKVEEL